MAEAGLKEDGEGPGARAAGEAAGVLLSAPLTKLSLNRESF